MDLLTQGWRELFKMETPVYEELSPYIDVNKETFDRTDVVTKHVIRQRANEIFFNKKIMASRDRFLVNLDAFFITEYVVGRSENHSIHISFRIPRAFDLVLGVTLHSDTPVTCVGFKNYGNILSEYKDINKTDVFIPVGAVDCFPISLCPYTSLECHVDGAKNLIAYVECITMNHDLLQKLTNTSYIVTSEWFTNCGTTTPNAFDKIIEYVSQPDINVDYVPVIDLPLWFPVDLKRELWKYSFKVYMMMYKYFRIEKEDIADVPPYAKCQIPCISKVRYFQQSGHEDLPPFCCVYPLEKGQLKGYHLVL